MEELTASANHPGGNFLKHQSKGIDGIDGIPGIPSKPDSENIWLRFVENHFRNRGSRAHSGSCTNWVT